MANIQLLPEILSQRPVERGTRHDRLSYEGLSSVLDQRYNARMDLARPSGRLRLRHCRFLNARLGYASFHAVYDLRSHPRFCQTSGRPQRQVLILRRRALVLYPPRRGSSGRGRGIQNRRAQRLCGGSQIRSDPPASCAGCTRCSLPVVREGRYSDDTAV